MKETLINFDDVPLGGRIRYKGSKSVYAVVSKYRVHTNTEPMCGTLVEYTGDIGVRQSMVSHLAWEEGCDEMVYFITDK